jgi:hypothetical protein
VLASGQARREDRGAGCLPGTLLFGAKKVFPAAGGHLGVLEKFDQTDTLLFRYAED